MEREEKVGYILEQVRLCMAKKDFIRTLIIAKKIQIKARPPEYSVPGPLAVSRAYFAPKRSVSPHSRIGGSDHHGPWHSPVLAGTRPYPIPRAGVQ